VTDLGAYSTWWHEADPDGSGIVPVLELDEVASHGTARLCAHARFGRGWIVDDSLLEIECDAARRELLAHVPLAARPPRRARVLVVGGGDGAIPGSLLEHDAEAVGELVLVDEPDLVSLAYETHGLPQDARLVVLEVAAIREAGRFDLVIVDRLPGAPGLVEVIARCLGDHADVAIRDAPLLTVRGARWLGNEHELARLLRDRAPAGRLVRAVAPSPFPRGGFHAFFFFAADGRDLSEPVRPWIGRHYDEAVHRAAFALPAWWPDVDAPRLEAGEPLGDSRRWWHEETHGTGITQALALRPTFALQSSFQSIEVHEHPRCGAVLTIDGTVQLSEADDVIYNEMAAHVPLLSRPFDAASVLIIGGGDGGVLREVLRHDFVRRVVMVELDAAVVEVSRRHVRIDGDYDDPRVELVIDDGARWVPEAARRGERFDVVVIDAADSTRPPAVLWKASFYEQLAGVLKDSGVCVDSDIAVPSRAGELRFSRDPCPFSIFDVVRSRTPFAAAECYHTRIPLYPGGYFAFFLYSKSPTCSAEPCREFFGRHYTPAVHRAAFALPAWWRRTLDEL
jgi:spermidine synthase